MRQCEMILLDIARALEDVRKTAEAIQTRQRVVRALVGITYSFEDPLVNRVDVILRV